MEILLALAHIGLVIVGVLSALFFGLLMVAVVVGGLWGIAGAIRGR